MNPSRTRKSTRRTAGTSSGMTGRWERWLPLGLAASVPQILRGENHVDYRYESYVEDNDRISVETHGVYFEQQLIDALTAKGELIYDDISGATPIGTHDLKRNILLTQLEDTRKAANLEFDAKLGSHTLTPAFAYSGESDYTSYGISLGDAIEFNEKNTTLQFGLSHNFDNVRMSDRTTWNKKQTTDGMIGISQLLSPDTIFSAAFTYGNDSGYLSDPYRLAEYHPDGFPAGLNIGVPERRPSHRNRQVLFTSLTQYFDKLDASIEGSYRFYHDSYGIFSHTVEIGWHQWLFNKHLMLEPSFRFGQQSAASFYSPLFSGPFATDPAGFHSSDYRLSELYTLTYGIKASVFIAEHVKLVASYHRYQMAGMNRNTSTDMYPQANVFTAGLSILW